MKVVTSDLLQALKSFSPTEFIHLRGRIKAAKKEVLLSAPGQNIRGGARGDGGPEPEVAEDLLDHRRESDKKTVKHRLAMFE